MQHTRPDDSIRPSDFITKSPWSDPVLSRLILSAQLSTSTIDREFNLRFLTAVQLLADVAWYSIVPASSGDEAGPDTISIDLIFSQKSGYHKVSKDPSVLLDSKPIKLTFWRSMLFSFSNPGQSHLDKLFIKNLSKETTSQELELYLARFGEIKTIHRFTRSDGSPTRFALIIYKDPASARLCQNSNHPKINKFKLKVRPFSENQSETEETLEKIVAKLNRESFKLADSLSDEEYRILMMRLNTGEPRRELVRMRPNCEPFHAGNTIIETQPVEFEQERNFRNTSSYREPLKAAFSQFHPLAWQTSYSEYACLAQMPSNQLNNFKLISSEIEEMKAASDQQLLKYRIPIQVSFYAFPNETIFMS